MKKFIYILALLPFVFISCVSSNVVRVTQAIVAGEPSTPKESRSFKLNVVFTNDVHGHVDREGKIEGTTDMATFAGFLDTMRENNENLLLLDAGDFLSGTIFSDYYRGASMIELANMLGYNAMTIGNQDFMYGYRTLVSNMEAARRRNNFYVSQNVRNGGKTATDRYKIFNFNGFKVAVVGLTTPETTFRAFPDSISGLSFDISINELQRDINSLTRVSDYIILLSHVGQYQEEDKFLSIRTILRQLNGIDLCIDGHSHTLVEESEVINGCTLVQAGSYMSAFGIVELEVDQGEVAETNYYLIRGDELEEPQGNSYLRSNGIVSKPSNAKVADFIMSKKDSVKQNFGEYGVFKPSQVVAYTATPLYGEESLLQTQQTDLGYVIAEAYTNACDADFSIVNAGSIRSGLNEGEIRVDDIYALCPYSYAVVRVSLTGKEVWDLFQYAASALPSTDSRYPLTDLHIEVSPNLPIGSKVTSIYFRDGSSEVVNSSNVIYTVAINDYMLSGGDGFDIPRNGIKRAGTMRNTLFGHITDAYPAL